MQRRPGNTCRECAALGEEAELGGRHFHQGSQRSLAPEGRVCLQCSLHVRL